MKSLLIFTTMTLVAQVALADGLNCIGQQTATIIKVYNHTDPTAGTRNPAIMIVSSPFVNYPNKTIAKFTDVNQTLDYQGSGRYIAKVDLRYKDSSRGGENIAGTKLNQLEAIELIAQFTYANKVNKNVKIPAILNYRKLSGEVLTEKADCTRYLKN
jgi:hypothetical protein